MRKHMLVVGGDSVLLGSTRCNTCRMGALEKHRAAKAFCLCPWFCSLVIES